MHPGHWVDDVKKLVPTADAVSVVGVVDVAFTSPTLEKKVFEAIPKGDTRTLHALIEDYPNLVDAVDKDGSSALYVAAAKNQSICARILLDNGANVHCMRPGKGSALHAAAANGHVLLAEMLLQSGANPFVCNSKEQTALDVALKKGEDEIIKLFLQRFLFCGLVSLECEGIAGLVHGYKRVKVMLLPRYPYDEAANGVARKEKIQKVLWIFSTIYAVQPRTQIHLGGAAVTEVDLKGTLHLAPSHPQPSGVFSIKEGDHYCIFLGPASYDMDDSYMKPNAEALTKYRLLLFHCDASYRGERAINDNGSSISMEALSEQCMSSAYFHTSREERAHGEVPLATASLPLINVYRLKSCAEDQTDDSQLEKSSSSSGISRGAPPRSPMPKGKAASLSRFLKEDLISGGAKVWDGFKHVVHVGERRHSHGGAEQ